METKKIYGIPLTVLIVGFLAIGSVSALIASSFGFFTTTLDVELPISVSDSTTTIQGIGGETVVGELTTVTNIGINTIPIEITSTEEAGVTTYYTSELNLTQKIVDFGSDIWAIDPNGDKATISYVLGDANFSAEVISGAKEGYVLIYYKDNSDRFSNPAEVILVEDVVGDLPYENDGNAEEYDYCETGEYDTCHGAKIWYMPSDAINGDNTPDWSRAGEFLYETELIQSNADSIIDIFPESDMQFYPVFDLDTMFYGTADITTTVDLAD